MIKSVLYSHSYIAHPPQPFIEPNPHNHPPARSPTAPPQKRAHTRTTRTQTCTLQNHACMRERAHESENKTVLSLLLFLFLVNEKEKERASESVRMRKRESESGRTPEQTREKVCWHGRRDKGVVCERWPQRSMDPRYKSCRSEVHGRLVASAGGELIQISSKGPIV